MTGKNEGQTPSIEIIRQSNMRYADLISLRGTKSALKSLIIVLIYVSLSTSFFNDLSPL